MGSGTATCPTPAWNANANGVTTYGYDVADRLVQMTGPDGAVTTITYDLLGRKMSMNDPDMGAWSYTYDTAGNLVTQTDARNVTIGFGYDGLNRLTQKWQSGSSSGMVLADYSYDASDGATQFGKGRRTGMRAYVGGVVNNSASWTYDKRGRVTAETHTIDGEAYTLGYTYDSADRVRRLIYPTQSAETVNLAYTTQGLPARMYSSVDYVRSGNTVYDEAGRLTQLKLGKQSNNNNPVVQMAFTYHPWTASGGLGRLQQVKAGTSANASSLQDLTYGYDTAGNVRWIVDARTNGQRQCFSYDGLDRLLRGFTGDATCAGYDEGTGSWVYDESYSYNNARNLVSKTGQGTYGYGVAQASTCPEGALVKKHAVVSTSNGSSYCYDQNGNMRRRTIGGNTYTLTYDDENRLVSISGAATASFTYDADGNRVKSVMNGETDTTIGNLYEKKVAGGATTHTKYYYFNGQRVAVRVAGVLYWLLRDHLGSTTVTANGASGVREAELWYKPWGENRGTTDAATPTKRRFTGQVLDEVAGGLYFYNARYYDPYLNRWIQPDSIIPNPGDPQNLNRYSYCRNNPLRFIDPSGHDPLDQAWQEEFEQVHHHAPTAEDILIRLFSIAFPGEWNWSVFYDADGNYVQGNLESVFRDNRPANWSWNDMPSALKRLTGWYKAGEEGMFTRDIGSLFGGLANRLEAPNAWPAVSNAGNPIRTWVYLDRPGLSTLLMGTSDDDANVHHWAWALTMGAEYGPGGSLLNTGREITQFHGDWRNSWSDVSIGNRGAALGVRFRVLGLTDITHAWNLFMLDRWF